ncbi:Dam family site-specific DNA-(adenine-N6)-methyltransferase [Rheinheimera baltica]|uniref:Site-specific DNA-methyltransferase (adenine-specific) n=1 Tax=Rheinheimera baltica TaxID=67576 RepID=A0ABT9I071_9GAMM|nr:Dam family site-specific DNA-(adenine-N6)-methyltransferase [Rheinheimera baltica]MDP5136761.1 Dam family site-specific DNA-(adenine-N6)-methyltransferase [Rheinheimera baltica]MDP5144306.1 Dam family site-specific DNA-(adenine-N6)-methyltransferase [Rheinheimera baltica]MDP5151476.1 Dam family site-specific DNA-(adenine-N6)-methyltransferase [Rheinheimera baltica]MDP5191082.1 Dam family site-specific DNA-(adenine-N6)-methyltransferase [Rheinheimera baltica]
MVERKKTRAFLKWAGGKYNLIQPLSKHLAASEVLIEPFVGAGSVFLNTDYDRYQLNDINADLIGLYQLLKTEHQRFISDARTLFSPLTNQRETYLQFRQQFNQSSDNYERALLFLYLNRHGYNGLCRYNLSGKFNVPFGSYKKPYFPEAELIFFAEKAQKAEFSCLGYQQVIQQAERGNVIYCDPPYVPLSKTASFTSYASQGFNLDDQAQLANLAEQAQQRGISVVISNHDTTWSRKIYQQAVIHSLQVGRSISQKGSSRGKVAELFAVYQAMPIPKIL